MSNFCLKTRVQKNDTTRSCSSSKGMQTDIDKNRVQVQGLVQRHHLNKCIEEVFLAELNKDNRLINVVKSQEISS